MPRIVADTNVLVHALVRDDVAQAERVGALLREGAELVILPTVLLELEWVLRSVLRFPHGDVVRAFADLLALPGTALTNERVVLQAVEWHEAGMDFADALHLADAAEADEFATFDRDLARRASHTPDTVPVRLL